MPKFLNFRSLFFVLSLLLVVTVLFTTGTAHAALDVTGVATALTTNLTLFETVGVSVITFVLGVSIIYGIVKMVKGGGKG
jgi:hypothetical protein